MAPATPAEPRRARGRALPQRLRDLLGRRVAALALALAAEALLLLALLSLNPSLGPREASTLTEVDLAAHDYAEPVPEPPQPDESPERSAEPSAPPPVETAAPQFEPEPVPAVVPPLPVTRPAPLPAPPRPAPPAADSGPAYGPPDTGGPPSDDSQRVGTAPNGEPLYAAQWYRRPGKEFDGFLSAASPGYGLMACRTIRDFYVTDCVPLDETPGSMLTRSMLAGSGVLRVRPPRLGGRSLVGAWVRIRIDYSIRRE